MKLQIIETPGYVLAVSDEEIKDSDYQLVPMLPLVEKATKENIHLSYMCYKIIAYQPKGDASELDLPLLPEIVFEDNIEKLAERLVDKETNASLQSPNRKHYEKYVKIGLKAATKVYSEEDLRKALSESFKASMEGYNITADEIIQSIKQTKTSCFPSHCLRECSNICLYPNKTPKWFVAETEDIFHSPSPIGMSVDTILKTTTINGKTYLVGTYLYE
jgi:hypothetical protein